MNTKNLQVLCFFANLPRADFIYGVLKMATDDVKKVIEREEKWQRRWRDARAFIPKNDGLKPK